MSYNRKTWNYDRPNCFWEEMPWFFRWPMAAFAVVYFGGAFLIPILLLFK